jgi:hypothetical protein
LVGSIYGRSSIKIAHFVPIGEQTWPPQAIIVSDWLISKISSLLKKDNSCLNIDICIQNAVISIQIFSSPCQCELLPSLGVRRPLSVVH